MTKCLPKLEWKTKWTWNQKWTWSLPKTKCQKKKALWEWAKKSKCSLMSSQPLLTH